MHAASVIPQTMPAWRNDEYGTAGSTRQVVMATPEPGRGEVLLRVRATALNAADVRLMLGDPLLLRPVFGIRRPKQPVRGIDVAGTVVAVGEEVDAALLGDEVVVELDDSGGLAPYALASAARLVRLPEDVAPDAAATLPIAGGTAIQALDVAEVGAGQRILVIGASGGVGTFTVSLATLRGAEVWATCGAPNRALIERIGAVRTLDYRQTDLADLPAGSFDAIIDIAGTAPLRTLKRLLTAEGIVAMVAGDGGHVLGPIPRMLRALFLSIGSRRRIRPVVAVAKREVVEELVRLTAEGRLSPIVERTLPWEAAVEGLARLESGRTVGKVVVLGYPEE